MRGWAMVNPWISTLDAKAWLALGDTWAGIADRESRWAAEQTGSTERARSSARAADYCAEARRAWARGHEVADQAQQGFRELTERLRIAQAERRADRELWDRIQREVEPRWKGGLHNGPVYTRAGRYA